MAAVDALLRLLIVRSAELLIIASGDVPVVRKAGETSPLSMPPLGAPLVTSMVEELVDGEARARLDQGGSLETEHLLANGSRFALLIERRGAGYRLSCRVAPPRANRGGGASGRGGDAGADGGGRRAALPAPAAAVVPIRATARLATGDSGWTARAGTHDATCALDDSGGEGAQVVPLPGSSALVGLVRRVLHQGASDLLLSAGRSPHMRLAGELCQLSHGPVTESEILALAAPALDDAHRRELERTGSTDSALELVGAVGLPMRLRLNLFRQSGGLAAALRPIRSDVPTLAELHLPAELHQLTGYSSGLVLVTGRAGAGKSTTLVALIEELNRTAARHVITLEDPIEYRYQPDRCLIHQREVGVQVDSFAGGLRAALRESPDVILVGEMRDQGTIAAALTAAETGHLVLSTMHCASAWLAVDRVIDVFPERQQQQVRQQLALTLRAVLTQVLVPGMVPPLRYPAHEKMVVTGAVASQIRDGKVHQLPTLIQTGRGSGMVPMERSLAALVRSGKVSPEAARAAAPDPARLTTRAGPLPAPPAVDARGDAGPEPAGHRRP